MVLGITLKLPEDMRVWWNGRHKGLKIPRRNNRAGSSPATGTTQKRPLRHESPPCGED